jgi:hypothetical protein
MTNALNTLPTVILMKNCKGESLPILTDKKGRPRKGGSAFRVKPEFWTQGPDSSDSICQFSYLPLNAK